MTVPRSPIRLLLRPLQGAAIGLVSAAVILPAYLAGVLEPLERKALDARFRLLPPSQNPPGVVVIEIDQGSIEHIYRVTNVRWPWPREFYTKMIEFLTTTGARATVFDVFFSEPGIDRDLTGEESDALLAAATRESGRVYHTYVLQRDGLPPFPERIDAILRVNRSADIRQTDAALLPGYTTGALPPPALTDAARAVGFANLEPDSDGIIRRLTPLARHGKDVLMSMALAVYWDLRGRPPVTMDRRHVTVDGARFPIDRDGRCYLWWYAPAPTAKSPFIRVPFHQVLSARIAQEAGQPLPLDPSLFTDRVVVLGSTAPGLFDIKATPLSGQSPGVYAQATALANLLRGDVVARTERGLIVAALLGLCLVTGIGVRTIRSATVTIAGTAVLMLALCVAGYTLLAVYHVFLDIIPLLAGMLLTFIGITVFNYLSERRHSRLVRHIFEHYLDRSVVQTLITHPERVKLGGERRDCTVLFSDVANFTHTSERMEPEELVHFMNVYLEAMTSIIIDTGGFVDKFVGDEIVAIFGAPADLPDHAQRACRALIAMQERLRELQRDFHMLGSRDEIFFRAGLSSGPVVVGNMGSESRMNYTAMGDVMNLGARLESANKQFGTRVLVSESTVAAAGDAYCFRCIDRVRVKGKDVGVSIYELVGPADRLSTERRRVLDIFAGAFELYQQRQWDAAEDRFAEAADMEDEPARRFVDRCRAYRKSPPPEDWDGVFTLTQK